MNSILHPILSIAYSILLALPPGWCCGVMLQTEGQAKQPAGESSQAACCQKKHVPADESQHVPAPQAVCCCDRTAIAPEKAIPPAISVDFAFPAILDVAAEMSDSYITWNLVELPYQSGPPLRVLRCVWRC